MSTQISPKAGCGCIVVFLVGIAWLTYHGYRSGPAPEPRTSLGDIVRLEVGSGQIPLGSTKADAGRITDLAIAKDRLGLQQMLVGGRAFSVDSGTRARIIGQSMTLYEVRIEEGPMTGRSGWLPREFAKR